jgi:acetylornithine deacetylase/succinyl-diaminopimelate desuccinylase-like protein
MITEEIRRIVCDSVDEERLVRTARALVDIPSPTCDAGAVANKLAELLVADGFGVERVIADWPKAPAVVVRVEAPEPGRTLQFDGHLDTVHLPFIPSRVEDGILRGSGASDMKGGVAAFVEALRVLKETGTLARGAVLMTAHDHHEGPWGDKRQLKALIREGYVGDAVLLPEYLAGQLPLRGRGLAIFNVKFVREGEAVHEVLRPADLADVNAAGADFMLRLRALNEELSTRSTDPGGSIGPRDSVFTGHIAGGEIYNQAPVSCLVSGTRRWVQQGKSDQSVAEVEEIANQVAKDYRTRVDFDCAIQGDAFTVADDDPIVDAFQAAYTAAVGHPLMTGEKPFMDDGNLFNAIAGISPITHGPDATGAHTLEEAVPIAELVRVSKVYALTAIAFGASG